MRTIQRALSLLIMEKSTPVFRGIAQFDDDYLCEALSCAPHYDTKVASAIGRTIRCIHGLESLHSTVCRDQLEVYLGRATESTLPRRWKAHAKDRKHQHGAVLFTCDPSRVEVLESLAIKVLRELRNRDSLCVGNANYHSAPSGGSARRGELALIYMTWRKADESSWDKPGMEVIRNVAQCVAAKSEDVTKQQLLTGLKALKRLSECDPLHWWEP